MRITSRRVILILTLLFAIFIAWYFSFLLWYFFFAGIITMAGRPLVDWLARQKIGKFQLPDWLCAMLAMLSVLALVIGFVTWLGSRVVVQLAGITSIDYNSLTQQMNTLLASIDAQLHTYGLLDSSQHLSDILTQHLRDFISGISITRIFSQVLSTFGSIASGLFAVIFLSFFFLRDRQLLRKTLLLFVPYEYESRASEVISSTRRLLTRYVSGIFTEVILMIILLSGGLWIMGIPNALLLGTLGGTLNIIPYLGPIIGAALSTLLGLVLLLSGTLTGTPLGVSLTIIGVFLAANLIDNLLLQPIIYSKSIKAHPVEVFVVILMAGSMAGITGMILAMPAYTILRIIGMEFFSGFDLMKKISGGLNT
ncbi:MAG: AI-2E family transporter [Bacteroidales bacterium]